MKKIIVIIISFVFLGACAQTTALIGPAITVGSTGNVMQAGFSYASNMAVKKTTGKTPSEHVFLYVEEKNEEKKHIICFLCAQKHKLARYLSTGFANKIL